MNDEHDRIGGVFLLVLLVVMVVLGVSIPIGLWRMVDAVERCGDRGFVQ